MKTTAYRTLVIIFMTIGSWISGNSQQYTDSLHKYLEITAKNNPTVQQKFIEYQAAVQRIPQVGTLPDPELSAGVFLKPMELVGGNQVADLRLMQMFPWFGVLRNAKDEMSLMANAKFEVFRDAKLQVFYDVQRTWYELFKIRKDILISEKNIEILKVIERLAIVRFKASPSGNSGSASAGSGISTGSSQTNSAGGSSGMQGMSGNKGTAASVQASSPMQTSSMGASSSNSGLADLYQIQIETGELQNNIAFLKNQEQTVIVLFNSYLNRPPVSPVFTGEVLVADSLGLSLIAVSDSINSKNPMLSMLEFEKQSYSARKKMVSGMGYPMVGLGMNYSFISKNEMSTSSMNGNDMIMPMVSITLPIYRKKYAAMQKEAELLALAASRNYQATANTLQTEYYQAVQSYQDAKRRVKLYENQYNLASKSLDLILKSFSASASGLTDVLRVRQQTLYYELKQVEAVADLNTAVAWLKRLGNLEIERNRWK
jgi:outer membrane protein TolC